MKQLILLLVTITTILLWGCSEDKKVHKTAVIKTNKISKIKTVDELFSAMEEKFKTNSFKCPRVTFSTSQATCYNKNNESIIKTTSISVINNPKNHKGLRFYSCEGNIAFYSLGEQEYWMLKPKDKLIKERFF